MEDETVSGDSGCSYDMPMDVLKEIFIYLPVKSLIRFTCVCKSWLHLIRNDPQFAIKHYLFRTVKPSSLLDNVDYLADYFGKRRRGIRFETSEEVFKLSMYSLTEKKTFRFEKKIEFGPGLEASISNFCHGIMCVFLHSSVVGAKILLCNPVIREVVPIPISVNITTHGKPVLGLGFDPTNNDYKVMSVHRPEHAHWLVDVYSVRDGCWHKVQAITPLDQFSGLGSKPALNANGRILNWLGCKSNGPSSLLSFDMVDEVFKETALPFPLPDFWSQRSLLSSSHFQACFYYCGSSFNLIERNECNGIDLWVLNSSTAQCDNMWTKQVSFGFSNEDMFDWPLNFWMNDKELFVCVPEKEGNVEEVFHYDVDTQELKRTGRLGTLINPYGYSESLVSIKGLMSSSQRASRDGNGDGNEVENQEPTYDGGLVCFIREVGRRNDYVRWSFSF